VICEDRKLRTDRLLGARVTSPAKAESIATQAESLCIGSAGSERFCRDR
jgi:hypothetical protein